MPTGSAHVARGTSPGILSVCGVRNVGCGGSTARAHEARGRSTPPRFNFTNLAWVLAWVLVSFVVWELVLKLVSTRGVFPFKLCLDSFSRSPQVILRYGQPLSPAERAVVGGPRKRTAFTLLSSRKGSALCEEAGPFVRLAAATAAPQIPVSQ